MKECKENNASRVVQIDVKFGEKITDRVWQSVILNYAEYQNINHDY